MFVIVTGVANSPEGCRAEVLISRPEDASGAIKYIFVVGRPASSPEQALRVLLEDTMAGLKQERERMGG